MTTQNMVMQMSISFNFCSIADSLKHYNDAIFVLEGTSIP